MQSNKAALKRCCKRFRGNMRKLPFSKKELESVECVSSSIKAMLGVYKNENKHEDVYVEDAQALAIYLILQHSGRVHMP